MAYVSPKKTALEASGSAPTSAPAMIDNRREQRYAADGTVCLILDRDGSEAVHGRLADVSRCGFRALHRSQELTPGRVIRFHFEDRQTGQLRSGWARVIWSRIQDSMVESGCFIVIAD